LSTIGYNERGLGEGGGVTVVVGNKKHYLR